METLNCYDLQAIKVSDPHELSHIKAWRQLVAGSGSISKGAAVLEVY